MTYTGLSPDTLVSTNHGVIPVHCVTTTHKVKSFGGYKKIKNVKKYFDSPVVALENSNDLPLVGSPKTEILVQNDFCQLKNLDFDFLIGTDSGIATLLKQEHDPFSLLHYAEVKNDTKKQTALFEMLGCLIFSVLANETVLLKTPCLIEVFRRAAQNFGCPATETTRKDGTLFEYGHIPKLCGIFERYALVKSLDNMVQDLVLSASIVGKLAFLQTLLLWFVPSEKYQKLSIPNYLMRRQLQVLFSEFGITAFTQNKQTLHIPIDALKFKQSVSLTQPTTISRIEKYGVSDIICLTIEDDSPYLANTFLIKT